jgi:hypothetical protein
MSEGVEHAAMAMATSPIEALMQCLSLAGSRGLRRAQRCTLVPGAGFEPASCPATGFKPAASTNFATRALVAGTVAARFDSTGIKTQQDVAAPAEVCIPPQPERALPSGTRRRRRAKRGGAGRSRTDLLGFAIRCITALLPRHVQHLARTVSREGDDEKGKPGLPFWSVSGAGDESRTRDLNLGKVALYQLSYSRIARRIRIRRSGKL